MSKGTPKNGGTPASGPANKNEGNGKPKLFEKGGPGGPGRPKSSRSVVMEGAWDKHLTAEKASEIVLKVLECAVAGEALAVKEVNDRSMGKPKESLELTGEFTLAEFYRALAPKLLAS